MSTKHRVLFAFLVLLISHFSGPKGSRAPYALARIRRAAERASDALDRLHSVSAAAEVCDSRGAEDARAASASDQGPDWLVDYFRSQGDSSFDVRR